MGSRSVVTGIGWFPAADMALRTASAAVRCAAGSASRASGRTPFSECRCTQAASCRTMGSAQEALVGVRHNLTLCRRHQLNDLGWGRLEQGRYAEAIDYLRSALPLSLGAQRGRLEGVIEGNCGTARLGQGHYE